MMKWVIILLLIDKIPASFETDLWIMELFHSWLMKFTLFLHIINVICSVSCWKMGFPCKIKKLLKNLKNKKVLKLFSLPQNLGTFLIFLGELTTKTLHNERRAEESVDYQLRETLSLILKLVILKILFAFFI